MWCLGEMFPIFNGVFLPWETQPPKLAHNNNKTQMSFGSDLPWFYHISFTQKNGTHQRRLKNPVLFRCPLFQLSCIFFSFFFFSTPRRSASPLLRKSPCWRRPWILCALLGMVFCDHLERLLVTSNKGFQKGTLNHLEVINSHVQFQTRFKRREFQWKCWK